MKKEHQARSRDKQTLFCPVSIDTSKHNSMFALAFNCAIQLNLRKKFTFTVITIYEFIKHIFYVHIFKCTLHGPNLTHDTKDSQNTGNFTRYSFRIVCGFFNFPHWNLNMEGIVRWELRFVVLIQEDLKV